MFVSEKKHNELLAKFEAITAELTLANETLSSVEELVSSHEKTIETLTAEKQAAVEALANANVETLTSEISTLKLENTELRKNAGATTAISDKKTDAGIQDEVSASDKLNQALAEAKTPAEKSRLMAEYRKNNK